MITKRKIVPIGVKRGLIRYGKWSIDHRYGLVENDTEWEEGDGSLIEIALIDYGDLLLGDVFVVHDIDNVYVWGESSQYLMKMRYSNWLLTGDSEHPLHVDNTSYKKVWVVLL